jgi:hypothetical protein
LGGVPPRETTRSETLPEPAGADADATQTIIIPPAEVREKFQRVKPLKELSVKERGWTLDELNIVRRICDRSSERQFAPSPPRRPRESQSRLTSAATNEFTNAEIYAHARELEQLHPDNRSLRTATRQNPPAASSFARREIIDSRRRRRLESAVIKCCSSAVFCRYISSIA